MQLSLLEILWITIVSMGIVFVLTILMFLMQGSSKVIQILEAKRSYNSWSCGETS